MIIIFLDPFLDPTISRNHIYSIIANDCAKVGRLQAMNDLNELGAIVGVDLCEQAARENAQLQKQCNCLVFRFAFCLDFKIKEEEF